MNEETFPVELQDLIPVINPSRNYWLVRSMGGDFYNEFKSDGFIAIGYNEISIDDIRYASSFQGKVSDKLKEIIENKLERVNSNYATHQLLKFANEIKLNDIIVVPGPGSGLVLFGVVSSESVFVKSDIVPIEGICPFQKRRNVKWLDQKVRWKLNPKLQLMFNSRHIISNIDNYAPYIDSLTNDFYIKDDKTHLVLSVRSESEVKFHDYLIINDLYELVKDISNEYELEINTNELEIKSNVQSPGDIILAAVSPQGIALIGLLIIFLNGGGLKIEDLKFDLHTDGFIKNVSNFLDRRRDRQFKKMIAKKIEHLDIKEPNDLVKILEEMNKPREKY